MELSLEQQKAFDGVMEWQKGDDKEFVLAGYAGAGKTTLAKYIAEEIRPDDVSFCAFTGKAANVLREKGCQDANTLHSNLYSLIGHDQATIKRLEDSIDDARKVGNSDLANTLSNELAERRLKHLQPKYQLNEDSKLKRKKLVIVDEYSMLGDKLIVDLRKIAKKILYIGDPFQLPPVNDTCSLSPNFFITEIHRQALDSAIIRNSKAIREGQNLKFCQENDFDYLPKRQVAADLYASVDQIIVGKNQTRKSWNDRFRKLRGVENHPLPQKGEKLICLKNNHEIGLFNGMIGHAARNAQGGGEDRYILDFDDICGLNVWKHDIIPSGVKYDAYNKYHRSLERFDYGYAITAHKSQGSEFDNVLVYNEPIGKTDEERRRWIYTSITRGKKKVTLVEP